MKTLKCMGVQETYQNFRENITVDVYSNFAGKVLTRNDIVGLANGATVNLEADKLPECIKDIFEKDKDIPECIKWILTEEGGMTRISITKDCQVNINIGDAKRNFVLNDAMYKALHGLVSSNRDEMDGSK